MIISHVKIIAFQTITNHSFWTFYIGGKPVVCIINRKIDECLEIPDLFLVLNSMICHVQQISCSTLEINLVFPRAHACIILYIYMLLFLCHVTFLVKIYKKSFIPYCVAKWDSLGSL